MPAQPLGPTGLLAQSMTLPAGSQSMSMGGMAMRAQGMDGRKKGRFAGRYLIVGGGGSANNVPASGGGGAGELIEGALSLPPGIYPIEIGPGRAWDSYLNGAPTTAFGMTARGGGRGDMGIGVTGGSSSGGGGGADNTPSVPGTGQNTNAGGSSGTDLGTGRGGGGGGGAGGPGLPGSDLLGGNGGPGKTSNITGSIQRYAAGGRGAYNGGPFSTTNGLGWASNNGSGGDAQSIATAPTGVVIWSYASPIQICTGGTVTSYLNGSTRWWVHTFTSSGTLVVP